MSLYKKCCISGSIFSSMIKKQIDSWLPNQLAYLPKMSLWQ